MKKIFLIVFMVSFFFGGVATADPAKILLNSSEGNVTVERDGQIIDFKLGDRLQEGDVIKTGAEAVADIAWPGKWGYRLLGSSECVLNSSDKKDSRIEMVDGNIIVNIESMPANGNFQIQTPMAVTAVRGTQFWGQVRPAGDNEGVTFAVREGQVEVTALSTGQTFLIAQGQALDILKEAEELSIRDALPEEMAAMAQADEINLQG